MTEQPDTLPEIRVHLYNRRKCPSCGGFIYGMPGGRDATCVNCGYKDPCCSD